MSTTYQAVCKLHPDFTPEPRAAYADAEQDVTDHYADAHNLDIVTIESE